MNAIVMAMGLAGAGVGAVGTVLPNSHNNTYDAASVFGPTSLTVDPITGKGFLDIPLFKGLSYNQMTAELTANPMLVGFQRGSEADFISLLNSAGWGGTLTYKAGVDKWHDRNGVVSPAGFQQYSWRPMDELMVSLGHTLSNAPQLLNRFFTSDVGVNGLPRSIFFSDVADGDIDAYLPENFPNPNWLEDYIDPITGLPYDFIEKFHYLTFETQSLQTGHLLWTQVEPIPEPGSRVVWATVALVVALAIRFSRPT